MSVSPDAGRFRLLPLSEIDAREIRLFAEARERSSIACVKQLCQGGFISPKNRQRLSNSNSPLRIPVCFQAVADVRSGILHGILSATPAGLVQHCLDVPESPDDTESLIRLCGSFFAERKIYCISGEMSAGLLLEQAARCAGKPHPADSRTYILMAYEEDGVQCPDGQPLLIARCSADDAEALFPLERAYMLCEVLPPGWPFNPAACRLQLDRILKESLVCAVPAENGAGFAAKASVNAEGMGWVQIGGVYTAPGYRNRGYAAAMVRHMARSAAECGKRSALFVKECNVPALSAYRKAGFVPFAHYRISYY